MNESEDSLNFGDAFLEDMAEHADPSQLPPEVQTVLQAANLSDAMGREASSILGNTLEAGEGMRDLNRLQPKRKFMEWALAQLIHGGVKSFASAFPERFMRPHQPEDRARAVAEIFSVATRDPDIPWFARMATRAVQAIAPSTESDAGWVSAAYRDLFVNMAEKTMHAVLGGTFFALCKHGKPEDVAKALVDQFEGEEIVRIMNYVMEASNTPEEAQNAIDIYCALIRAGVQAVAVKATGVVPLSTSAIVAERNTPKLADAFHTVALEADRKNKADRIIDRKKLRRVEMDSEWSGLTHMQVNALKEAALKEDTLGVPMFIALQAYDARSEKEVLLPLIQISRQRVAMGGEPIHFRLVCGANQLDEECRVSANGWDSTTLVQGENPRAAAHANYQRLLNILAPEVAEGNAGVVIASMNYQTHVWSMKRLADAKVFESEKSYGLVGQAILEGMPCDVMFDYFEKKYGEAYKRTVHISKYTPSSEKIRHKLVHGLAYNSRRVEELGSRFKKMVQGAMTTLSNWVGSTSAFGIGSEQWLEEQVKNGLLAAMEIYDKELSEHAVEMPSLGHRGEKENWKVPERLEDFKLIPRVDLRDRNDIEWMYEVMRRCMVRSKENVEAEGLSGVGLGWEEPNGEDRKILDLKGRPRPDLVLARFELATKADVDEAFRLAKEDPSGWRTRSFDERAAMILKAAGSMQGEVRARMDMALVLNAAKTFTEADEEVNESIEMALMHVLQMRQLHDAFPSLDFGVDPEGSGAVLEICPKNFPDAIPLAHITASLLAGYRVIVKPSGGEDEETTWATYEAVKTLWAAGVPKDVLIWLPCDNTVAAYLSSHPDCERIGFTGSTHTAEKIWENNPQVEMLGETGGRNVVVIGPSSNLKQVAHDLVYSYVNFAGQKCSKPIAAIVLKGVNLELLKKEIVGMMQYLYVGSPIGEADSGDAAAVYEALVDRTAVDCTPLSKRPEPGSPLFRAMTELKPGEDWLYDCGEGDPEAPKVKIVTDLAAYPWDELQEVFGPICTLVPIDGGIEDAVDMIKQLPGTLTGSLWSDAFRDISYALQNWQTGQLYINQKSTGALASAQFGDGVGDSHRGANGAPTGSAEFVAMKAHVTRKPGIYPQVDIIRTRAQTAGSPLHKILDRLDRSSEEMDAAYYAGWDCLQSKINYFSKERATPHKIEGQTNWVESQNVGRTLLRVMESDSMPDVLMKLFAAVAAGNPLTVSLESPTAHEALIKHLGGDILHMLSGVSVLIQNEDAFIHYIQENKDRRDEMHFHHVTFASKESVSDALAYACATTHTYMDRRPATGHGRIDMIPQYRVQSFTVNHQKAGDQSPARGLFRAVAGSAQLSPEEEARVWKQAA